MPKAIPLTVPKLQALDSQNQVPPVHPRPAAPAPTPQALHPTAAPPPPAPALHPAAAYARYVHPNLSQPPAAPHTANDVAEWRKMYALLIQHYETNGHSRINSTQHPQLHKWLNIQQWKYNTAALTAGQIQQLRFMKVEFIDRNESKLGRGCQRKKCTKFAAFEGFCQQHYSEECRAKTPQKKPEVIHNPANVLRATGGQFTSESSARHQLNYPQFSKIAMAISSVLAAPPAKTQKQVKEFIIDLFASGKEDPNHFEHRNIWYKYHTEVHDVEPASFQSLCNVCATIGRSMAERGETADSVKRIGKWEEMKKAQETKRTQDTKKAGKKNSKTALSARKSAKATLKKSKKKPAGKSSVAEKENNVSVSLKSLKSIAPSASAQIAMPMKNRDSSASENSTAQSAVAKPLMVPAIPLMLNSPDKSMASEAEARNRPSKAQDQHNKKIWFKHYGSLVLFYEMYGHTNVTLQHSKQLAPASLVTWVKLQKERFKKGLLSRGEVKSLSLLGIGSDIKTDRCALDDCTKFAVFNGMCHQHYTSASTKASGETDKSAGDKRKRSALKEAASNKSNYPVLKHTTASHNNSNNPMTIPPKFPIYVPTQEEQAQFARPPKKKKPQPVSAPKPKFPFTTFSKQKDGLYTFVDEKDKTKAQDIPREEVITQIKSFITAHCESENCISNDSVLTTCTCLHFLRDKPYAIEAVSHAILDYCEMTHQQKKHYAVERIRMAGEQRSKRTLTKQQKENEAEVGLCRSFMLPLNYEYIDNATIPPVHGFSREAQIAQLFRHKICSFSWHNIHHIGRQRKHTLQKYILGDTSVVKNKNLNNCNRGKSCSDAKQSVRALLQSLLDKYENEHEPDGVVKLPPSYSKRSLWRTWIQDQGWYVEVLDRQKQAMNKVKEWTLLEGFYVTEAEAAEKGGKVAGQKMTITSFTKIWKEEFPRLKVVEGMMKGSFHMGPQKDSVRALLQTLFDEYSEYENDPDEVVVLPASFSKRNLWLGWVREHGWSVAVENGKFAKYKDWMLREGFYATEAEAAANNGRVAGQKISFPSFYNIWKADFPRLKVVKGSED